MLFKKIKKEPEVKPFEEIQKPIEPPKPEIKDEETAFVTTDEKLVFSLQDRFSIKSIYYDKSSGLKTFVFNATKSEVSNFLKEEK